MLPSGPPTDKPMAKWRTLASVGVLRKRRRRGSRAGTLAVLEALGDSTSFSGTCTLSHADLAARAALSRRSVPRIIRRLERVPFLGLKVHRFRRPDGVNEVNRYTFNGAVWTTLALWTATR